MIGQNIKKTIVYNYFKKFVPFEGEEIGRGNQQSSFLHLENKNLNPIKEDYEKERLIFLDYYKEYISQIAGTPLIFIKGKSGIGKSVFLKYFYLTNKNKDKNKDKDKNINKESEDNKNIYYDLWLAIDFKEEYLRNILVDEIFKELVKIIRQKSSIIIIENIHLYNYKEHLLDLLVRWVKTNNLFSNNNKLSNHIIITYRYFSYNLNKRQYNMVLMLDFDELISKIKLEDYEYLIKQIKDVNNINNNIIDPQTYFNFLIDKQRKYYKEVNINISLNLIYLVSFSKILLNNAQKTNLLNPENTLNLIYKSDIEDFLSQKEEKDHQTILNIIQKISNLNLHEIYPSDSILNEVYNISYDALRKIDDFGTIIIAYKYNKKYHNFIHPDYAKIISLSLLFNTDNPSREEIQNALAEWERVNSIILYKYWDFERKQPYYPNKNFRVFRILDRIRERSEFRNIVLNILNNVDEKELDEYHSALKLRLYRYFINYVPEYIKRLREISQNLEKINLELSLINNFLKNPAMHKKDIPIEIISEILRGLRTYYIKSSNDNEKEIFQKNLSCLLNITKKYYECEYETLRNKDQCVDNSSESEFAIIQKLGSLSYTIGSVLFRQNKLEEAKKYFRHSIKLRNKINDIQGKSYQYREIAKIYLSKNKKNEYYKLIIEKCIKKACEYAEIAGDLRIIITLKAWNMIFKTIFINNYDYNQDIQDIKDLLNKGKYPFPDLVEVKSILNIIYNQKFSFKELEQETLIYKLFKKHKVYDWENPFFILIDNIKPKITTNII
ncbi:MAG: hypothetical protein ACTSRZ_17790 [Promethearchaeota archaeon]